MSRAPTLFRRLRNAGAVALFVLLAGCVTYPNSYYQNAYPYGEDGNGGPPILDALRWGALSGESGRVATPEPLFPRLESEAVESATS